MIRQALTSKQYESWHRNMEIAELYGDGMTLAAIGEKLGISRQAVQQRLITRGVVRRTRSAYHKKHEEPTGIGE